MAKQPQEQLSISRQYLNQLNKNLVDLRAKKKALDVYYIPLADECKRLAGLVTSVKKQIMTEEEGIDDLKMVKPTNVASIVYMTEEPQYKIKPNGDNEATGDNGDKE